MARPTLLPSTPLMSLLLSGRTFSRKVSGIVGVEGGDLPVVLGIWTDLYRYVLREWGVEVEREENPTERGGRDRHTDK